MTDIRASRDERLDLYELISAYTFALDQKDWKAFDQIFAADMDTWSCYGSRTGYDEDKPIFMATGLRQVVDWHKLMLEPLAQTHHMLGNRRARIDGDHGDISFYLRAYHLGKAKKASMFEHSLSFGRAWTKRTDVGWRMTKLHYVVYIYQGTMELFSEPDQGELLKAPEERGMLHGGSH